MFELAEMWEEELVYAKFLVQMTESKSGAPDLQALCAGYKNIYQLYTKLLMPEADFRMFGTYYRVGFYGKSFTDGVAMLDGVEYVYKYPQITMLPEVTTKMKAEMEKQFGEGSITMLQDSRPVKEQKLAADKLYIQITATTIYFDSKDLQERTSYYAVNHNIHKFMYETPYARDGNGLYAKSVADQCKIRVILHTEKAFPQTVTRLRVVRREEILIEPIQVAIEEIQKQASKIEKECQNRPPNRNALQSLLQGSLLVQVNQGIMSFAEAFLTAGAAADVSLSLKKELADKYKFMFHILKKAVKLNGQVIDDSQQAFHSEIQKSYTILSGKINTLIQQFD